MGNIKPVYGKDARTGLFKGMTLLNDAVKVTLGPRGRNVLMRKVFEGMHPSKDGVTVAKEIELDDELQHMGVLLVKETSENTNDNVGDGTTTSTLLAWSLCNEGLQYIDDNSNPVLIKKGIDMAIEDAIKQLNDYKIEVNGNLDMIINIATISANNDAVIGDIIGEGLRKIGINGTIKVEESDTHHTYIDPVQGIQFKRGYASPYFVTDTDKMEILYDAGCLVTITREKLTEYSQIQPIVDYAVSENVAIAVIADDYTNEFLAELITRKLRAKSKVFLIKSPYFGVKRDQYLEDLSVITGCKIVSADSSISYNNFEDKYFGKVDKCLVTAEATMMINGFGDPDDIQKHIGRLDSLKFNNPLEEERNKARIDILTGGIAVLYVGASSESEMKEKKDRVDDALAATKAAIEEGVIPGGGSVLMKIGYGLDSRDSRKDVITGYEIVKNALRTPFDQILLNAGKTIDEINVIYEEIISGNNITFDVVSDSYVNPVEKGILDPLKVARVALLNAASVAGTLLTTECVLVNNNIQKQESELPNFLRH